MNFSSHVLYAVFAKVSHYIINSANLQLRRHRLRIVLQAFGRCALQTTYQYKDIHRVYRSDIVGCAMCNPSC